MYATKLTKSSKKAIKKMRVQTGSSQNKKNKNKKEEA